MAVSCVRDTKVVARAVPPKSTWEPVTKLAPVTVREKLPTGSTVGVTLWGTGRGFCRLTELLAERDLSAKLVAWTFTEFGVGRLSGAWYFPVESIVPTLEFPPATPFTDQATT